MVKVSDKSWSSVSESDYTEEQFKKAALLPGESKSDSKFPVYFPDGSLSRAAVHNAAARFNQANLSSEDKAKLKKKLRSLYSQIGEDPPDVLKDSETAYQTPYDDTEAVELGSKLWRKQVLPHRSISYKGGTLSITPEMAKRVVENHRKKPFEYVPFVIGHSDNPEAGRGEVVGLSNSADGVEAIIQTDDAGTKMIEGNGGKLPVSVRLLEDYTRESDGEHFGPVIQHVAATYTPRMTNMRPWEAVEASSTPDGVVDLSEESYDALADSGSGELSAEDQALIDEVEREVADESNDEADNGAPEEETEEEDYEMADMPSEGDTIQFKRGGATHEGTFKRLEGEGDSQVAVVDVDGEEVKVPVSMLNKGSSSEGGSEPKENSDERLNEGGSSVDLAELEARDRRIADLEAKLERSSESERRNTLELRRQKVERELEEYGRAGVPAADLDAARPLLMDDDSGVELSYTDLSEEGATEKKSPRADLVRKMLDSRKGTVEFGEKGDASAQLSEDDAKDKKIREYAKEHEMSYGEAARHVL